MNIAPCTVARWALMLLAAVWTALLSPLAAADGPAVPAGTVVHETLDSTTLRGNLLGEPSVRSVSLYLPPGYAAHPKRRYPVVFLLHGYTANDRQWTAPPRTTQQTIDAAMASGSATPTIIVWPDGSNSLLGSFYTDSVATGDWEQFITSELVKWVDGKYRTLARRESRGIAGHSMGGYGAIKLAMKHPEVFSAVYGMSPCCLGWAEDMSLDNPAFRETLAVRSKADVEARLPAFRVNPYSAPWLDNMYAVSLLALAAAWSPDPGAPPFFAALPVEQGPGGLVVREAVRARWSANMPLNMLDQYHGNLKQLRGIAFDVGTQDAFKHIPVTARELSQRLTALGIPHEFDEFAGRHSDQAEARIGSKVLPFFARMLDSSPARK